MLMGKRFVERQIEDLEDRLDDLEVGMTIEAAWPPPGAHWKKTATGYEMGAARLLKVDEKWVLRYRGKDHVMGRRASLDHAEGILANLDRS